MNELGQFEAAKNGENGARERSQIRKDRPAHQSCRYRFVLEATPLRRCTSSEAEEVFIVVLRSPPPLPPPTRSSVLLI